MRSLTPGFMLTVIACGGMSGMSMSGNSSAMGSYGTLGGNIATTLATYQASTSSMPDDAACDAAHAAYETAMAPMVDRMRAMSDAMDAHVAQYANEQVGAEMTCFAEALAAELARHHAVACTAPGITLDRSEAGLHVEIMSTLLHHERALYEAAGSTMGMMQTAPDATWSCELNANGTFTIGNATWTPGQPLESAGAVPDVQPWPMPCDGSCSGCSSTALGMGTM